MKILFWLISIKDFLLPLIGDKMQRSGTLMERNTLTVWVGMGLPS